jgi:CorA-like Mg2+ transporter protein
MTPWTSSTACARWPTVRRENLQGTIEFYRARTNTKVTIAAERLAVIAAITLPVTAVSSILGMNVIVNDQTQPLELAVAVAAMAVMSVLLVIWAKRQGWWWRSPEEESQRQGSGWACSRPDHAVHVVGVTGFEPVAPRSQSECATKLRHTPCPASLGGPPGRAPADSHRRVR